MWKEYLPSKKVVAILIIPIVTIILYFVFNNFFNTSKNNDLFSDIINKKIDTDGDGLEDWEEELAGTDKTKKDTDGDGFSDALEVKTGSDPLDPLNKAKKKIDLVKNIDHLNYDYRFDPNLTNTDRVTYRFLEEGVKLKNSNMSLNKGNRDQLVDSIIGESQVDIDLTKFSKKDLNIKDVNRKEFKQDLMGKWQLLKDEKLIEEVILLNKYLNEGKDPKYLVQIEKNLKIHKKYLDELKNIEVPDSLADIYLKYLNSYNAEIEVMNYYSKVDKDPVSLVIALGVYKEIDSIFYSSLLNLISKIK